MECKETSTIASKKNYWERYIYISMIDYRYPSLIIIDKKNHSKTQNNEMIFILDHVRN